MLFLSNFAINASNHNSDTLKKAITIKIINISIANIIQNAFDPDLDAALNMVRDIAIQTAKINNCIIDIFSGPIWNDMPLSNHFFMFLGYTTFIWI